VPNFASAITKAKRTLVAAEPITTEELNEAISVIAQSFSIYVEDVESDLRRT
jgi:hypothetical protein